MVDGRAIEAHSMLGERCRRVWYGRRRADDERAAATAAAAASAEVADRQTDRRLLLRKQLT